MVLDLLSRWEAASWSRDSAGFLAARPQVTALLLVDEAIVVAMACGGVPPTGRSSALTALHATTGAALPLPWHCADPLSAESDKLRNPLPLAPLPDGMTIQLLDCCPALSWAVVGRVAAAGHMHSLVASRLGA